MEKDCEARIGSQMELKDFNINRKEIFTLYDKGESDAKKDLIILREWMKKMPHLPANSLSDAFLEIYLLKNKFSVEKTKRKIEAYCSRKAESRFKYFYEKIPSPLQDSTVFIALPQLTDDFQRILCTRVANDDLYDITSNHSSLFILKEFLSRFDYNNGEILIFDWLECSSMIMTKFRINVITDTLTLLLEAHSSRISQIHVINKAAKFIVSGVIYLLPSKLASRVHFHDDYETLRKMVPAKYLPSDFGGELHSLDVFLGQWDEVYKKRKDDLLGYVNTKANEELRPGGPKQEEMQGTFKSLSVD